MSDPALLRAVSIRKSYGATAALKGVDFAVVGGAVNVLIGENGAGKSTLMRVLAGVEQPDGGQLLLDGEAVTFASVRAAARQGIGIVFQELNLCPNLSVTQNIFLGREQGRSIVIDPSAERAAAAAALARLGARIDPDELVGNLRVGQQQIVEIARALIEDVRVLILDEPTSALSAAEVDILFSLIRELKRHGVGIVYISHRLEELMQIGDYITVLRDGELVDSAPAAEVSIPWIVDRMLGERGGQTAVASTCTPGEPRLCLSQVTISRPGGAILVDDLSLDLRAGEIAAIYGLLGAGRTELFEFAMGLRSGTGEVRLGAERLDGLSTANRVEKRLLLVPEDRQREGLFPNLSVGRNLELCVLTMLQKFGIISARDEQTATGEMMRKLGVKAASPDIAIGALSGGNQQKVVIGRCLLPRPLVLLLDEPTRGIDIGARADVFAIMRALAADGLAVAFSTSDVMEALAVADRIVVMASGRVTADMPARNASEEMLVSAASPRANEIVIEGVTPA